MQTYQVMYGVTGDSRWRFFDAIDDEEAAWKANCWTKSNGFELIDVKQIREIDHET